MEEVATLTVAQTARTLGVHANTVRRWAQAGVLHPVRLPQSGFRRFRRSEVLQVAASMRGGASAVGAPSGDQSDASVAEQWAEWVDRARAEGIHVDLDEYNARVLACQPVRLSAEDAGLPEPWGDSFQPVTYKELLTAFGDS
jgi:excisionase family DNA binding protein